MKVINQILHCKQHSSLVTLLLHHKFVFITFFVKMTHKTIYSIFCLLQRITLDCNVTQTPQITLLSITVRGIDFFQTRFELVMNLKTNGISQTSKVCPIPICSQFFYLDVVRFAKQGGIGISFLKIRYGIEKVIEI